MSKYSRKNKYSTTGELTNKVVRALNSPCNGLAASTRQAA